MTKELLYHGTPATQVTVKVSVLAGNMTRAQNTQLEAWAVEQEVIFGTGNVFTEDAAGVGLPPRGKRSES